MSKKLPAFQFYTGDWLKDPALSKCTPETRGVWIDLICAMHESGRLGELCGTTEQLARIARCSTAELDHALAELSSIESAGVTFRNGSVTVVNRRMAREHKRRQQDKLRQRSMRGRGGITKDSRSHSSSSSSDIPLPPSLGDTRLTDLWASFQQHRREMRRPLTPEAARRTLVKLEGMGVERAIAALDHSISQGWQGVFEPNGSARKQTPAVPKKLWSEMTPEEIEEEGRRLRF